MDVCVFVGMIGEFVMFIYKEYMCCIEIVIEICKNIKMSLNLCMKVLVGVGSNVMSEFFFLVKFV